MYTEPIIEEFGAWLTGQIKEYSKRNYMSQAHRLMVESDFMQTKSLQSLELFLTQGQQKRVYSRKAAIRKFLKFLETKNMLYYKDYEKMLEHIKYKIKNRRDMDTLVLEKIERLIKEIKDEELRLLVMMASDTGARITSLLRLKKTKIIKYTDKIDIVLLEKGDNTIVRQLVKQTEPHLDAWLDKTAYPIYVFFPEKSVTEEMLKEKYVKMWSKLKNESRKLFGGKGVSWHWIRRGSAVYWYNKLHDIEAVKEFLGHRDVRTTSIYLKLQAQKVAEKMPEEKRGW